MAREVIRGVEGPKCDRLCLIFCKRPQNQPQNQPQNHPQNQPQNEADARSSLPPVAQLSVISG